MLLEIPFDAAGALQSTTLKTDRPDVYARYTMKYEIRVGVRSGARIYTMVGYEDLQVIREYFCLWLNDQSFQSQEQADTRTLSAVRTAVFRIDKTIKAYQDRWVEACV